MNAIRIPNVRTGRPRLRPDRLAADKAYSTERVRSWLRAHAISAVIPRRSDQRPHDRRTRFDKPAYRRRSSIERAVGWLKEARRIATRFEKLAVNFAAMLTLAFIRRYLRVMFSDRA